MVARWGILRNHGRNNNSPATQFAEANAKFKKAKELKFKKAEVVGCHTV
jgi:hypothetical protein